MSIHESEFTPGRLFRSVPPASKIAEAFRIDLPLAKRIRGILRGEIDPRSVPETDRWCRSCFHEPRPREQAMHAVDALLDTFGVEYLDDENGNTQAAYCNAGDTYAGTMIFRGKRAYLGCWGDLVESLERRGVRFR